MSRAERVGSPHFIKRFPLLVSWALLCALVTSISREASASERVQLAGAEDAGAVVEEVLVRAQAELGAVGFSVVRCPLEESTGLCAPLAAMGRLEVKDVDGRLALKAWASGEVAPLTQELDLGERGVSAEVAAIRAVELLRATLLLSLREGNLKVEDGGSVQRFTGWEDQKEAAEPVVPPPLPPAPPLVIVQPSAEEKPRSDWAWAAGVGPLFSLPGVKLPPGWGGEFFVDTAFRSFYFGAAFNAALIPSSIERPEGRTDISSIAAIFRIGWSAGCGEKWVCRVGPHLGILQFDFDANESAIYRGSDARHLTWVSGLNATLARFVTGGFGGYLRTQVGIAARAAQLQISDPVTLGRPTSSLSLGVIFR